MVLLLTTLLRCMVAKPRLLYMRTVCLVAETWAVAGIIEFFGVVFLFFVVFLQPCKKIWSGPGGSLSAGGLKLPFTTILGTYVHNLAGDRVEAPSCFLLCTSHTFERQSWVQNIHHFYPWLQRNTFQSKDGHSGLGDIFNPRRSRDISCAKLFTELFSSLPWFLSAEVTSQSIIFVCGLKATIWTIFHSIWSSFKWSYNQHSSSSSHAQTYNTDEVHWSHSQHWETLQLAVYHCMYVYVCTYLYDFHNHHSVRCREVHLVRQLTTLSHCISHGRYHLLLDYTGIIPTPDCHSKLYTDVHTVCTIITTDICT